MNLYYAFTAGVLFTLAVEFLLAWAFAWKTRREIKRVDAALKKTFETKNWADYPPGTRENIDKIENFIKEKFPVQASVDSQIIHL